MSTKPCTDNLVYDIINKRATATLCCDHVMLHVTSKRPWPSNENWTNERVVGSLIERWLAPPGGERKIDEAASWVWWMGRCGEWETYYCFCFSGEGWFCLKFSRKLFNNNYNKYSQQRLRTIFKSRFELKRKVFFFFSFFSFWVHSHCVCADRFCAVLCYVNIHTEHSLCTRRI